MEHLYVLLISTGLCDSFCDAWLIRLFAMVAVFVVVVVVAPTIGSREGSCCVGVLARSVGRVFCRFGRGS